MSHTYHTTPAFPRTLRGPRGGRHIAPTPCAECVSFTSCRPGTCSAPFGCESWVDEDGRRVEPEPRLVYADAERNADETATEVGRVEFDRLIKEGVDPDEVDRLAVEHGREAFEAELAALDEADPKDPNPYAPSPATLSEMSGIFPTTDDPGPLFGGRESD